MSIATEITRLQNAKSALATSMVNKGVTVPAATKLDGYAALVDSIQTGGGGDDSDDTVFYFDYDGTVVQSYTKQEFLALSSAPSNPSHEGLTSQGWNWSLADAKAYVTKYDYLTIGQLYKTTDGNTKIYITIDNEYMLDFTVYINATKVGAQISVSWGDGSNDTFNITRANYDTSLTHTYQTTGDYVIQIIPEANDTETTYFLGSTSSYPSLVGYYNRKVEREKLNYVRKVHFGRNISGCSHVGYKNIEYITTCNTLLNVKGVLITGNDNYLQKLVTFTSVNGATMPSGFTFAKCRCLKFLSIAPFTGTIINGFASYSSLEILALPEGMSAYASALSNFAIDSYNFKVIIIPSGLSSMGSSSFHNCQNLKKIVLPSITGISGSNFDRCAVEHLTLTGVTSLGNNAFVRAFNLKDISLPNTLTTIGNSVFSYCTALEEITIPNTVTSIGTNAFDNCISLTRVTLPNTLTALSNNLFLHCAALAEITLPSTITTIGNSVFSYCSSLVEITIPASVTSMGTNVFQNSWAISKVVMLPTTPPTIQSNTFDSSLFPSLTIYVPAGCGNTYKTASNWSSWADYIVELS